MNWRHLFKILTNFIPFHTDTKDAVLFIKIFSCFIIILSSLSFIFFF